MRSRASRKLRTGHRLHFEVGQDEVISTVLQLFQGGRAAFADIDVDIAKLPDDALHDASHRGKVVYNQDRKTRVRHGSSEASRKPRSDIIALKMR